MYGLHACYTVCHEAIQMEDCTTSFKDFIFTNFKRIKKIYKILQIHYFFNHLKKSPFMDLPFYWQWFSRTRDPLDHIGAKK